jgi:hypothetical protein
LCGILFNLLCVQGDLLWILFKFDPVVTVSRIFHGGGEIVEDQNLVAIHLCHNPVIQLLLANGLLGRQDLSQENDFSLFRKEIGLK